ncbi:MAG: hypothetical protein ABFS32_14395 [Bacteroidota bacterium]
MSTFNIDEEITLKSCEDITNRSGYISSVEPKKYSYNQIVAVYTLRDQECIPCSVSDCLKPHTKGFLITTANDKETNFCENCGIRILNVAFEEQVNVFQRHSIARKQKIRLNRVLEQADEIKERVLSLKEEPKGANWLYRVLNSFIKTYPLELYAALKELATNPDNNSILSNLTENKDEHFQLENIQQLRGLAIFAKDIREELIIKILKPLKELEQLASNSIENQSLIHFCQWADSLEQQFTFAENLTKEGRAFFDLENLERLKSIPLSEVAASQVRSLNWDSSKVK